MGAEGRKEVKLDFFEAIQIPLPPLATQRAILGEWQKAQQAVAEAEERIHEIEAEIEAGFFGALGLKTLPKNKPPKCFAVELQNTISWNVRANFLSSEAMSLRLGKYPVVSGRECLQEVKHGSSAPPSPRPSSLHILKISAVTRGEFLPSERKFTLDTERVRREFSLRQGDVLMCRTNGTLAYVGMSALVYDDMPDLIFPDKVIRVRTKDNLEPGYLWFILQTHHLRLQIEAVARTAVGNYAIGSNDIWNLRIPLPPLDVQRQITADVEAGRAQIAREREAARALSRQIEADIEAYILGTRKVGIM